MYVFTRLPLDRCRYTTRDMPEDLWETSQVGLLALGMQLASSAWLLPECASAESSPPVTYPFADVAACCAFVNCFCALELGSHHERGIICLIPSVRDGLRALMLRGARQVAADPGAPGLWPVVLLNLVQFIAKRVSRTDASSQEALGSVCGSLLHALHHGEQLMYGQLMYGQDVRPASGCDSTGRSHARRPGYPGAAAAAGSAAAAGMVLHAVVFMTDTALVAGRLQVTAAIDLSVELVRRCAAQLADPAAGMLLPLPLPEQLLYPQANPLQARIVLSDRFTSAPMRGIIKFWGNENYWRGHAGACCMSYLSLR